MRKLTLGETLLACAVLVLVEEWIKGKQEVYVKGKNYPLVPYTDSI